MAKSIATEEHLADQVRAIVSRHAKGQGGLIPMLQEVQGRFGYLSQEAVRELALAAGVGENEIYGVASFYSQFRFHPPGDKTVCVCQGTACHVGGGEAILDAFQRELGIRPGNTTEDGAFALERVACIGCCALAPAITLDGKVHARMTPEKVRKVLQAARTETAETAD